MSYLQKRNQSFRYSTVSIVVVLFVIVAVVYFQPAVLSTVTRTVGLPFLRMRAAAGDGISIFGAAWGEKEKLAQENRDLKEKITTLEVKASLYDEIKSEYDDLLRLEKDTRIFEYARVLSTPKTAGYDILILDIGSADHVVAGDLVLGYDMLILGHVEQVSEHSARVVLFSAPESETPVVFPKSGVDAVAHGKGGGAFVLEVPQDTDVAIGDAIALRTVSGRAIAVVADVSLDPTDAFKTIHAAVPINIFDLRHVGIFR